VLLLAVRRTLAAERATGAARSDYDIGPELRRTLEGMGVRLRAAPNEEEGRTLRERRAWRDLGLFPNAPRRQKEDARRRGGHGRGSVRGVRRPLGGAGSVGPPQTVLGWVPHAGTRRPLPLSAARLSVGPHHVWLPAPAGPPDPAALFLHGGRLHVLPVVRL